MKNALLFTFLTALAVLGGVYTSKGQLIVYEETFSNGTTYCPSSSQYDNWGDFRDQLSPTLPYIYCKISGSLNTTGATCSDPVVVAQLAAALNAGNALAVSCGGITWSVGNSCITGCAQFGDDIEFNAANSGGQCSCGGDLTLRPCIGNSNWGSIGVGGCGAPTQTMRVEFLAVSFADDAGIASILSPTLPTCDLDSIDIEVVVVNQGSDTLTSCDIKWQIGTGTPTTYSWTGSNAPYGGTDTLVIANYTFSNFDDLTVWTENPNGGTDSLLSNDTSEITVSTGLSGTYGIPGDYSTFQDAADDLTEFGVCGHVVIEASNGTYTEQMDLGEVLGTGPDATVTFRSVSGNQADVKLQYASTSTSNNWVVNLNASDYIHFENMTVRNTGTFIFGRVFAIGGGADYVTIDNCHLRGVTYGYTGDYAAVVYANGQNHGFTLSNCLVEKGAYSLRYYGGGNTSRGENITIKNNRFEDSYYMGTYMWYINGLDYSNNVVTKDTSYTYVLSYGAYFYYADDFNVSGNYIGASEGASYGYSYGLYMNYCVGGNNPKAQLVNNCITSGTPGQTNYGYYPMYMYGSGNVDIVNNSFNRGDGQSGNYYAAYINQGGGIVLKNNNFANLNSGYALYCAGLWTLTESDHNNFYTASGTLLYQGSTAYSSLAAYQVGSGHDMNSVSVNPAYEDTVMCITCNDTLDGGGINVGNMYDIDSNVRSTTTPDIGAVEYINAANFTLGGDTTVCGDEFLIEAGPAQSVTWSVNGSSSTGNSYLLQATGTSPELFNISVSMTTAYCGTGTDQAQLTLVPDASLDSNIHICADEVVTLDPGGGSTSTYTWSTGETTSTVEAGSAGDYSVTKIEEGCASMASTYVSQSVGVEIPDLEECEDNAPITLDATILDGTNYAWSGGNSMNSAINTFDDGGMYTVTATDAHGCVSSDSFQLDILGEPTAVINYQKTGGFAVWFDGTSSSELSQSTTYTWTFDNGNSSTSPTPVYVFPFSGSLVSYTVSLEIDNGCGVDVKTMQIDFDIYGVNDLETGSFVAYPNPADDIVNIVTNDMDASSVQILDISGRMVAESGLEAGSTNITMDVSNLSAGSYMIKIGGEVHPLIID